MVEKVVASAYNEQAARVYNWDFPNQKWINFSPTHKTSNMKIVERGRQLFVKIEPGGTDERFEFDLPQDVQVTKTGDMIQFAVPDRGDKTGGKLIAIKFNEKTQEEQFTRRASTKIPGFQLPIQAAPQTGQPKPPPESLSSAPPPPAAIDPSSNRQRIETFTADRYNPSNYQPPTLPKNQGRAPPPSNSGASHAPPKRPSTEAVRGPPRHLVDEGRHGDGGYRGNEGRKSPLNNLDASLQAPPIQALPPHQPPTHNQPLRQDWTPVPKGSGYHDVPKGSGYHDDQKFPDQSYGYDNGDRHYHDNRPSSGERYRDNHPSSREPYHGYRPPSGEQYHGNRPSSGEHYHDNRPNSGKQFYENERYREEDRYHDDRRYHDNQRDRERRDYREDRRDSDRDGRSYNDSRDDFRRPNDFRQQQEPYPSYHPNERSYRDNGYYDNDRKSYRNDRKGFPEESYDNGGDDRRRRDEEREIRREERDRGGNYHPPSPPRPKKPSVPPLIKSAPPVSMIDQEQMTESTKHLAESLSQGNQSDAEDLVRVLIDLLYTGGKGDTMPGSFSITFQEEHKPIEKPLKLIVQVEPLSGPSYSVYLDAKPSDNMEKLKQECYKMFKIPKECQYWVIGSKIAEDRHTMDDLQIIDNSTLYLYIQHPHKAKVHKSDMKEVQTVNYKRPTRDELEKQGPPEGYPLEPPTGSQTPPINNPNERPAVFRDSGSVVEPKVPPPFGGVQVMPVAQRQEEPPLFNEPGLIQLPSTPPPPGVPLPPLEDVPPPQEEEEDDPHWMCLACTYKNLPFRPVCDVCFSGRPDDYLPPANYVPKDEERKFIGEDDGLQKVNDLLDKEREEQEEQARRNYLALINTDAVPIVTNEEEFECPVCYDDVDPGDGIRLRGCLHMVCKGCLNRSVMYSEEAEVQCPYNGDDGECNEPIAQREIREVLNEDELETFFGRGLRQAEATDPKSFHCKTTDCKGFCFYEDEVNEFRCQICGHTNCILCKAQHEDMNCQEYQDDLKLKAANDEAARQTQEMLENMVTQGEAMHCPQCKVIVTKKVGCDWIRCVMCKTEMCWATKGPRWGPKGKGDTNGGCRCGMDGQKCHPQCHNCH